MKSRADFGEWAAGDCTMADGFFIFRVVLTGEESAARVSEVVDFTVWTLLTSLPHTFFPFDKIKHGDDNERCKHYRTSFFIPTSSRCKSTSRSSVCTQVSAAYIIGPAASETPCRGQRKPQRWTRRIPRTTGQWLTSVVHRSWLPD